MKINESFTENLKSEIPKEIGKTGIFSSGIKNAEVEVMKQVNQLNRELGETKKKKKDDVIRNVVKQNDTTKLVGTKKMKTPTGKIQAMLPIMGEEETTEAMGAAGAGGYSEPLFSTTKQEVEELTKVETKEATGSASSGQYSTPAAWAKSTSKKHWRGKSKTQIPGGKFVQVKKKCKKFPYCNQGDMGALRLTNEEKVNIIINRLSKKYNLSENIIQTILSEELKKFK
jgi:hypothetical protein